MFLFVFVFFFGVCVYLCLFVCVFILCFFLCLCVCVFLCVYLPYCSNLFLSISCSYNTFISLAVNISFLQIELLKIQVIDKHLRIYVHLHPLEKINKQYNKKKIRHNNKKQIHNNHEINKEEKKRIKGRNGT